MLSFLILQYLQYIVYKYFVFIAQFRVHTLPSGRVALQNVGSPDHWLTIYEGKTLGSVSLDNIHEETVH